MICARKIYLSCIAATSAAVAAMGAVAQEVSPLQLQLAAWCGAKFTVAGAGAERVSYGDCAGNRQAVMLAGPAERPDALQAQVDLRPENVARSRKMLLTVARELVADKDAPAAERFVEEKLPQLKAGESAEKRFGDYAAKLTRNSDVMATLVVAKGSKPTHKAFEW